MDWKGLPPLAALRAFEAAARHGSFTLAARDLNVTHAAVAQHVRRLEDALSERLVTRQGRGIAVTQAGRALSDGLTEGFGIVARAVGDLRDATESRPLTLSLTPAFAANWLMPRIGDFWTRHPDIPLNVAPSTDVVDIRLGDVDLAIRYGDGTWPGVEAELLTDGDFWAVVHPDLPRARDATCLRDVAHLPWLLEHYLLERRAMIEAEGIDLSRITVKLMATNALTLSAAQAGNGVTVQPKSLVERQVRDGRLTKVCALNGGGLGYHLVSLPGRTSPRVRTLRRWLHSQVD
ncbi:LysR family transcriptional regulator [Jannaschia sp. LMIT008]|uniref:LysR family transcriptional regulator n=1 Tax=Jannaschia maritima TaxID=3032585 RepID=UPI0028115E7C|nr:LysR family transcriptional regulator [Jannaschia sp. LMIT008]